MPRAETSDEKRMPLWHVRNCSEVAVRCGWLFFEWISKMGVWTLAIWRKRAAQKPASRAVGRKTITLCSGCFTCSVRMAAAMVCRSSIGQTVTFWSTCSFDCGPGPTQSTISYEGRSAVFVSCSHEHGVFTRAQDVHTSTGWARREAQPRSSVEAAWGRG